MERAEACPPNQKTALTITCTRTDEMATLPSQQWLLGFEIK